MFIRVSRMAVPALDRPSDARFEPGRAETLRDGADVTIIACGTLVHRALEAADTLAAEGIAARVLNMSSIAPLDEDAIRAAAATGGIVTVEEHVVRGGLGGAVAECVVASIPVPVRMLGFPGFLETGSAEWLMERHGLTADGIAGAARELATKRI